MYSISLKYWVLKDKFREKLSGRGNLLQFNAVVYMYTKTIAHVQLQSLTE